MQRIASPEVLTNPNPTLQKQALELGYAQFDRMHPLRLVAVGDSIVYGYGDPDGGGWVERLRRHWMQRDREGHILYNLGVRGDGVPQVLQRMELELRHRGELRNRLPDGVILSVGVNDSAQLGHAKGRNYTDFGAFQEALDRLLTTAQQLAPVWFIGMVPVDESRMPFLGHFYFSQAEQFRYKEATRQICLTHQVPYLDLFDRWQAKGEDWQRAHLTTDGLHPNSAGYAAILEEVLSWMPIARLNAS